MSTAWARCTGDEPCIDLISSLTLPFPPPLQLLLAQYHAARAAAGAAPPMAPPPPLRPRLRLAYVSSHFSGSSIGREMLYIIGAHDRARVAVGCFALNAAGTTSALSQLWRSAIASACGDGWADLSSLSDSEGAMTINSAGTHVLLDLNGWSGGHRAPLLALRVRRASYRTVAVSLCLCFRICTVAVAAACGTPERSRYSACMQCHAMPCSRLRCK